METKFAKGPWFVVATRRSTRLRVASKHYIVATVESASANTEDARADANLIAAAPELYEALEWCARELEVPDRLLGEFERIRAALAKARGEAK